MTRLIDLYPRAWRARYGDELRDLVTARPLDLASRFDLFRGALDAHRHPELLDPGAAGPVGEGPVSRQRYADLVIARRLGLGSWLGAILWLGAWWISANGPMVGTGDEAYRDGSAGMLPLLGSMVLLSGGLVGHMIRLAGRAPMARFGAFVAIFAGPLWALGPWVLPIGALAVAGMVILALAAWWAEAWGAIAALTLVGSALAGGGLVVVAMLGMASAEIVLAILALTPIWLVVGATLQALPDRVDDGDALVAEGAIA